MHGLHKALFLLHLPIQAAADAPATDAALRGDALSPAFGEQLAQVVGGLGIVLAMVLMLAWLAKRFTHTRIGGTQGFRLVGGLSLGAKERIVLVQVGETQLLVGVAPGRVQTLHVLDEPVVTQADDQAGSADQRFARSLSKLLNKEKGG